MRETRDGSLRKTVVWTLADGVWTMEVFDETVAPRELVRRDVRTTRPTARGVAHTLARGGEVVEARVVGRLARRARVVVLRAGVGDGRKGNRHRLLL